MAGVSCIGGFNHPTITEKSADDILKIALGGVNFWDNIFKRYNVKLSMNLPQIGMRVSKLHNIPKKSVAKFEEDCIGLLINYEPNDENFLKIKE